MTAAVGDSMNDLPMLAVCGLPYAVSDASCELARLARFRAGFYKQRRVT